MSEEGKKKWIEKGKRLAFNPGFYLILSIFIVSIGLFVSMIWLGLYPYSFAGLLLGLGLLTMAFLGYVFFFPSTWKWKVPAILLALLVVFGSVYGQKSINTLSQAMQKISQPSQELVRKATVYTYSQAPVASISNLNGQTVGVLAGRNDAINQAMQEDLSEQNISVELKSYSSLQQLVKALKGQAIRAVILAPSDIELIQEFSGMEKADRELLSLYSTTMDSSLATQPSDLDVATQPYTVLITSSNDPLSAANYRSSMNVLLTVNPKTKTCLTTFIPRSYWTGLSCPDQLACPAGVSDKIGFASFYTVESLKESVENLLGITVDFTVRVDLNTLLQLCDLQGPIKVNNDHEYTSGYFSFAQGEIELDGPKAKQYVGTLNDFSVADQNQEQNQLAVLLALIQKIKPAGIGNLKPVLDVLTQSVQTSFTYRQLCDIVNEFFMQPSAYSVLYYALSGSDGLEYSTALTEYAYVMIPDQASTDKARAAIEAVLNGQTPDVTPIPAPASEDTTTDTDQTTDQNDTSQTQNDQTDDSTVSDQTQNSWSSQSTWQDNSSSWYPSYDDSYSYDQYDSGWDDGSYDWSQDDSGWDDGTSDDQTYDDSWSGNWDDGYGY